jgi:hypothetical protein
MRGLIFSLLFATALFCGCSTGKVCDARGDSSETCEIHHLYMHAEKYPNPHLTTPPSQEYLLARTQFFIHSKPTLYMLPDECKSIIVFVCDDCVRDEKRWKAAHPGYGQ